MREKVKRDILAAYGVTWEEVEAVDRALGGPQLRERERRFREALPGRIAKVTAQINERYKDVLPAGFRFEWAPSVPPGTPCQFMPDLGGEEPPGVFYLTECGEDAP